MANGCDPEFIKALLSKTERSKLDLAKTILKARSFVTDANIDTLVESATNVEFTESDQKMLDSLITKVSSAGKEKDIRSVLTKEERQLMYTLIAKKESTDRGIKLAELRSDEIVVNEMERLEEALQLAKREGNAGLVSRIETLIAKVKDAQTTSTISSTTYQRLTKLKTELQESKIAERILIEGAVNVGQNGIKRRKLLAQIRTKKREIRERERRVREPGTSQKAKVEMRRKIKNLERDVAKLSNSVNTLEQKALSERNTFTQMLTEERKRQRKISRIFDKSNFRQSDLLISLAINSQKYSSPQTLFKAISQAEAQIEWTSQTISRLIEKNKTEGVDGDRVDGITIGEAIILFGENFVKANMTDKDQKVFTANNVSTMLKKFSDILRNQSLFNSNRIATFDMSTSQKLREQFLFRSSSNSIFDMSLDSIFVPSLSREEARNKGIEKGWIIGTTPQEHRFETAEEAISAIQELLGRIRTLWLVEGFSGQVPLEVLEGIYQQLLSNNVAKFSSRSPLVDFENAIVIENPDNKPMQDHQEYRVIFSNAMRSLGMTQEEIDMMPEFRNPNGWISDKEKIIVVDIETTMDADRDVLAVGIFKKGDNAKNSIRFGAKSGRVRSVISPEQARAILRELEELQNSGHKIITFNGNNFDIPELLKVALRGLNPNDQEVIDLNRMGMRIALRSIDMMQSVVSQHPGSNYPNLKNLAKASQEHLRKDQKKLKAEDTKGSDIAKLWAESNNGSDESEIQMLEYIAKDLEATMETFNGLVTRYENNIPTTVDFSNATSHTFSNIPLVQSVYTSMQFKNQPSPTSIDMVFGRLNNAFTEDALNVMKTGSITGISHQSRILFDLTEIENTVTQWLYRAMLMNPETRETVTTMLDMARNEIVEAKIPAAKRAETTAMEMLNGLKQIHSEQFDENGRRLILEYDENGNPILTDEENQEEQWISRAVESFNLALNDKKRKLDKIAKRVGFRKQETSESNEQYIRSLLEYFVKRFHPEAKNGLIDLANNTVDYVPAANVGYGIFQIINGHNGVSGVRYTFDKTGDIYNEDGGLIERRIRGEDGRPQRKSKRLVETGRDNVPWFSPLGLGAITKAWDDYRMRRRIHHILTSNLSPKEVTKMFDRIRREQREINERDVLYGRYTPRYYLTPPVNNRALGSVIPSLDMWREQTMEALLDIPTMMFSMTHDGFKTSADTIRLLPSDLGENGERAFDAMALSAGLPTGNITVEGIVATLSHAANFPITMDAVTDAIERGKRIKLPTDSLLSDSVTVLDYDASFSGAHMMAATILQWGTKGNRESILAKIKRDLNIDLINLEAEGEEGERVRRENDLYDRTMHRTIEVVDAALSRLNSSALETINLDLKNLQLLKAFLQNALKEGALREIIKGAVIPRLYEGGGPGIIEGLADRIQGAMLKQSEISPDVLNTFKDVLLSKKLVKMLGDALNISATNIENNILDLSIGITPEQKKQVWKYITQEAQRVQSLGAGEFRKFERRLMENYFEKSLADHQTDIINTLNKRIRKIAEASTPDIDPTNPQSKEERIKAKARELTEKYNKRIQRAKEYLNSVGGRITTDEHYYRVNRILSEDSIEVVDPVTGETKVKNLAYTTNTRLAALNVHNRVPRRLSEAALDSALQTQGLDVWRTNEDGSIPDDMGYAGMNLFSSFAQDSVTGRIFPNNGRSTNYMGPQLSKDLWEFGNRMLSVDGMTDGQIKEVVDTLIARDIMIRTAHLATPEIGNYDSSVESPEEFFRLFKQRSDSEDAQWQSSLSRENDLLLSDDPNDAEILKRRSKAGGRINEFRRRLLDPNRDPSVPISSTFRSQAYLYGPAGFRPMFASMAFNEVGSMALIAAATRMRQQETLASFRIAEQSATEAGDINSILPSRGSGYSSQFQEGDIPFVPESRVSIGSLFAFGDENNRLTQKTIMLKKTLIQFASDTGLMDLVNSGNWVRLYLLHRAETEGLKPYFNKIRQSSGKADADMEFKVARSQFLFDMFAIIQMQHDAAGITTDLTQLSQQMGFEPQELTEGEENNPITYIQLYDLLWRRGMRSLSSLEQGLTDQPNLYAKGSPEGLAGQSETSLYPQMGMGAESATMLALTLYSKVAVELVNDYVKAKGLDIKGTFRQGNKTLVSLGDVQRYAIETNNPNIVDTIFNLITESPQWRDRVADTMNLYLVTSPRGAVHIESNKDSVDVVERDPTAVDLPTYVFGTSILRKKANDPLTRIVFTPEILNQMLLLIKNFGTFLNAENAVLANMATGTEMSVAQEMSNYQRQAFYEMQRQNIMDEYDMLNMLHMESNNADKLRSVENTKMRQITGIPMVIVDGNYHMHNETVNGLTAAKDMWTLDIRRAIVKLERRGSLIAPRPELQVLNTALQKAMGTDVNGIFEVKAGVILSKVHSTDALVRMAALRSYFGNTLTNEQYLQVMNQGLKIAEALHTALTKPMELANPFYFSAQAFVERSPLNLDDSESAYQALMNDPEMNNILGVESEDDRRLAERAIHSALRTLRTNDLAESPRDVKRFSGDKILSLMNHEVFQGEYPHIASQIQELVSNGYITEETAEFYRGLIGAILKRNPNMASYLSFAVDPNLDRAGKFTKVGNTYTIKFGSKLKKRSAMDQIRILAHEMTHLARALYLETDGEQYRELKAIFQNRRSENAMRMMLGIMRDGMNEGFEAELAYYMSNVDEFLAEWGSYLLINEFFVKTGVLNRYEMQSEHVNKATSFWRKAFNRIKRVFSSIMVAFDKVKVADPDLYNRMHNILDSLFSFTATESARIVTNLDQEFDLGVMGDIETTPWKSTDEESAALNKAIEIKNIMETSLNPEYNVQVIKSEPNGDKLFRKTMFGMDEWQYLTIIDDLKDPSGQIQWVPYLTDMQEKAVIEFILRKVSKTRGLRLDDKETVAGILRNLLSSADHIETGNGFNLRESRSKTENAVNFLVNKGFMGFIGLVDNQIDSTWNSTVPAIVALSFLLDHTSGVVDGSFKTFAELPDMSSGAMLKKMLVQHFEVQWTAINRKFSKGNRAGHVIQASTRVILGEGSDRALFAGLSDEEFKAAVMLADAYKRTVEPFISMAFGEGVKPPKANIDPSYWAFVVERDMMSSTDKETQEKVANAVNALYRIQMAKLENNLTMTGKVDIPSLVGSGVLPPIIMDETLRNEDLTNWLKAQRYNLASEGRGSADPKVQFYLMWDNLAAQEWAKVNPSRNINQWETERASNTGFYVRAMNTLIRKANSESITWKEIMPSDSKGMNVKALFDRIKASLNPSDTTVVSSAMQTNQALLNKNKKGRPRQEKAYPNISKDTPVGYHIQMLMDSAGNTAYLPHESDLKMTINDVFGSSTEDAKTARTIFSHDPRQVVRGIASSIGLQAASRNVIRGISGVGGIDFKRLTHVIRTHLEGTNSYFDADGVKSGIDRLEQKKIVEMILRSLNILDRKYDVIGGVAERYDSSDLHPSMKFAVDQMSNATAITWGPNLNLATLLTEVPMAMTISLLEGTGTFTQMGDMLMAFISQLKTLSRPLSQLEMDAVLRTTSSALYDLNHSARTEGVETDIVEPVQGKLRKTFRWFKRANQIMGMTAKTAAMRTGSRYLMGNLGTLLKMREEIINYPDQFTLQVAARIIKKYNSSLSPLMLRTMMESNILGGRNLEILIKLFEETGGSVGKPPDLQAMIAYVLHSKKTGDTNSIELDGMQLSQQEALAAITTIENFMSRYANLSSVQGNPMDSPTKDGWLNWLSSIYRTYPLLYSTQFIYRDSARLPATHLAVRSMQMLISDLIYNLLLASLGGYLTYDDLEEMWKNDKEGFVKTLLVYAARNPVFGRGTSESMQLLNIVLNDKTPFRTGAIEEGTNINPLGTVALSSLARSGGRMMEALSETDQYGNWNPNTDSILDEVYRRIGALTRVLLSMIGLYEPPDPKNKRSSSRTITNGYDTSPFNSMDRFYYQQTGQDFNREQFEELYPWLKEVIKNNRQNNPQLPRKPKLNPEALSNINRMLQDRQKELEGTRSSVTPQNPAQAIPAAPAQSTPRSPSPQGTIGSRASTSATPPPELGGP